LKYVDQPPDPRLRREGGGRGRGRKRRGREQCDALVTKKVLSGPRFSLGTRKREKKKRGRNSKKKRRARRFIIRSMRGKTALP